MGVQMGGGSQKSTQSQTETSTSTPDALTQQWRNQAFSLGNSLLSGKSASQQPAATPTSGTFNAASYLAANPDVAQFTRGPEAHWNEYGKAEGRTGAYGAETTPAATTDGATGFEGVPQYYSGQTVADMSPETKQALEMLTKQAQGGAPGLDQAYGAAQSLMAGGNADALKPYADRIAEAGSRKTTMGVDALKSFDGSVDNPYLKQIYDQGAEGITDNVNAQFSKAGRFGPSSAYAGGLGKSLGSLYTGIYNPAYENAQNQKLQASTTLAGIDQSDRAAEMSGYTGAGSLYSTGLGLDSSGKQAGINALPSIYSYGETPGRTMGEVGSIYDNFNQSKLDAEKEKYDYNSNANWDYLQKYVDLMNGLGSYPTTTSSGTGTSKGSNSSFGLSANWSSKNGLSGGG